MSDAGLVNIESTRPTQRVDADHLGRSGAREIFVRELLGGQLIREPLLSFTLWYPAISPNTLIPNSWVKVSWG